MKKSCVQPLNKTSNKIAAQYRYYTAVSFLKIKVCIQGQYVLPIQWEFFFSAYKHISLLVKQHPKLWCKNYIQGKQLCPFQIFLPSQKGSTLTGKNLLLKEQILPFKSSSHLEGFFYS